ncbi:hypothetical protein RBB50_011798 [Rhinocladiella similis]
MFASTTAEAAQLKRKSTQNPSVPTYGVIVSSVAIDSINVKDQKATFQQILADNYTIVFDTEISYVRSPTKANAHYESPLAKGPVVQMVMMTSTHETRPDHSARYKMQS